MDCPVTRSRRIAVKTGGDAWPGRHVFRVQLTDPAGNRPRYYAANVLADGGSVEYLMPLALNETLGQWGLSVRDVATGVRTEASFVVESRLE